MFNLAVPHGKFHIKKMKVFTSCNSYELKKAMLIPLSIACSAAKGPQPELSRDLLRLVFTSDGVTVVVGVVRDLCMT